MQSRVKTPEVIKAFFEKHGQKLVYGKKQEFIRADDPQPWVYFLSEGIVEVSYAFEDNAGDRPLGYFVQNMVFAQNRSFFNDVEGDLKYRSVEPIVVYRVHRDVFLAQLDKSFAFTKEYLQMVLLVRIFTTDLVIYLGEYRIHNRCIRWLLLMAKYYGEQTKDGCRIIVPLTQDTVANFLHVSRESVSKTLREFTKNGHITIKKKYITITDLGALKALLEY